GSIDEVTPLVEQAIRLSPRDPGISWCYYQIGTVHLLRLQIDEAIVWFEKARSDRPAAPFVRSRLVSAYALRGETERAAAELRSGSIDEVTPLVEQAIRLSPRDPGISWCYYQIGTVHLLRLQIDEAIVWFEKARSDRPAAPFVRSRLVSAYALRGETERAAAEL